MKRMILFLYSVFVFILIDSIIVDKIISGYRFFLMTYAVILSILGMFEMQKHRFKIKISLRESVFLGFASIYVLNVFRLNGDLLVALQIVSFLIIAFVNAFYIRKYNLFNQYMLIFFCLSFAFIFKQFAEAGFPIDVYQNLSKLMMQERYRIWFGFYHVNAAGNLAACTLIISFFLLKGIKAIKKTYRIAMHVFICFCDFIIATFLLSTGSRTALLSVIVFMIICLYYWMTLIRGGGTSQYFCADS